MRHIENLVYMVLAICLGIGVLLWRQVSQMETPVLDSGDSTLLDVDAARVGPLDEPPLFRIDQIHGTDLTQGHVPTVLSQQLIDTGTLLTAQATVSVVESDSIWRITDTSKIYLIVRHNDLLDIYGGRNIPQLLRQEFTRNRVPMSLGAVISTVDPGRRWWITDQDLHRQYDVQYAAGKLRVRRMMDVDVLPGMFSLAQPTPLKLLTRRDVFHSPGDSVAKPTTTAKPRPLPVLSTIVWSNIEPRVVINGEILGIGDTDSQSQFRVESITRQHAQIRFLDNERLLWLKLNADYQSRTQRQ